MAIGNGSASPAHLVIAATGISDGNSLSANIGFQAAWVTGAAIFCPSRTKKAGGCNVWHLAEALVSIAQKALALACRRSRR